MPVTIVDGPTIAAGESLSDGADCSAGTIVRITVPQEYTAANMTFQVSSDGNLYNDLYTTDGGEIMIAARANTGIVVHDVWTRSIKFIKFRSGSRGSPVVQREDCKFAIAVETAQPMSDWQKFYSTAYWLRRRRQQLHVHPLCKFCADRHLVVRATIVDHVEPHRGNWDKFVLGKLQSLCETCHNSTKQLMEKGRPRPGVDADGWPLDRQN